MYNRTLVVILLVGTLTILTADVISQSDVSTTWCSQESLPEGIDGNWWSQVNKHITSFPKHFVPR